LRYCQKFYEKKEYVLTTGHRGFLCVLNKIIHGNIIYKKLNASYPVLQHRRVGILISFAGLRKKSALRYLVPEQKLKEEEKENKQGREHRNYEL
jgi:hypothetical protein